MVKPNTAIARKHMPAPQKKTGRKVISIAVCVKVKKEAIANAREMIIRKTQGMYSHIFFSPFSKNPFIARPVIIAIAGKRGMM